jgi:hypothetical protein
MGVKIFGVQTSLSMPGRAQIPLYTRSVKSREKTLAFFGWPETGLRRSPEVSVRRSAFIGDFSALERQQRILDEDALADDMRQSLANPSLGENSLLPGNLQGIFGIMAQLPQEFLAGHPQLSGHGRASRYIRASPQAR